ncbi:MAG TPA: sulfur carrier protein ThiS [Micromonosporaceae bacterium]|nr:sulfur carrier protein ThiS [Micromonosporaceae bacterium]
MRITVNGRSLEAMPGWSVGDLVRSRTEEQRRVAVARNGEVVPRGQWDSTPLAEGDLIEVLAPVAGG